MVQLFGQEVKKILKPLMNKILCAFFPRAPLTPLHLPLPSSQDVFFLLFGSVLVMFMQAGFALLEVGSGELGRVAQNVFVRSSALRGGEVKASESPFYHVFSRQ